MSFLIPPSTCQLPSSGYPSPLLHCAFSAFLLPALLLIIFLLLHGLTCLLLVLLIIASTSSNFPVLRHTNIAFLPAPLFAAPPHMSAGQFDSTATAGFADSLTLSLSLSRVAAF